MTNKSIIVLQKLYIIQLGQASHPFNVSMKEDFVLHGQASLLYVVSQKQNFVQFEQIKSHSQFSQGHNNPSCNH